MGLSSKKTKTTTKPYYSSEIKGAADAVTGTYNSNIGRITDIAGKVSGLTDQLIDEYRAGDPGIDAAERYNMDVLNGNYLGGAQRNPYVDELVQMSNDNVMNRNQAILGSRGLSGSSDSTGS